MTCPHCQDLRDEIAFLKRQLGVQAQQDQISTLATRLRLPPAEAQLLSALYDAKGRVLSVYQLDEVMPPVSSSADDRDLKHVAIRVCRVRKKLGEESIKNIWGRGYCLTDIGRLLVEEALENQRATPRKPLEAA